VARLTQGKASVVTWATLTQLGGFRADSNIELVLLDLDGTANVAGGMAIAALEGCVCRRPHQE
jgi:hypothetical protein